MHSLSMVTLRVYFQWCLHPNQKAIHNSGAARFLFIFPLVVSKQHVALDKNSKIICALRVIVNAPLMRRKASKFNQPPLRDCFSLNKSLQDERLKEEKLLSTSAL